jgi:hypothetical protein
VKQKRGQGEGGHNYFTHISYLKDISTHHQFK